jgi:hypothetical protein
MTNVIRPGRPPSSRAKGLALALTVMNLTIVVTLATSLAATFLMSLDGVDADAAVAFLAVIGLLLACTAGGRRGLARHPRLALLVMGVPGVLVALFLIFLLVLACSSIGQMEDHMLRSGQPAQHAPMR